MKFGWLFREILREQAGGEVEGGGTGTEGKPAGGEGKGEVPKTFNINGKDIPIEKASAALNLYQALEDPEVGKEIIEQLARRSGIIKEGEKPTKSDEKKLEGRVTKLIKSRLGKDYEKFADLMGPVIDDAVQDYLNDIKAEFGGKADSSSWEAAVENFIESNDWTPELEAEMERLITRNGGRPPGLKGKAAIEYLEDMRDLAAHKLGLEVEPKRTRRAPDNEPYNRRSRRDEIPDFREEDRPKNVTLDQIVSDAMKGIRYRN